MLLSNLSNALKPLAMNATTTLKVNDAFSLSVVRLNVSNQVYNARAAEFTQKHKNIKADEQFFNNLWSAKYTQDGVVFAATVLIADWALTDDEGKKVEFTEEKAVEILSLPNVGEHLFGLIVSTAINSAAFQAEWESVVTKN